MFPAPGGYFFAASSQSRGHVHPNKSSVIDPSDYPLPPHLIRWPQTSPGKASPLRLATAAERFPVPRWLSPASRTLFEKGPAFLSSPDCLLSDELVVRDWLPAFCAHTSPLLEGEHGVALDYLKTVLASAEEPWQVELYNIRWLKFETIRLSHKNQLAARGLQFQPTTHTSDIGAPAWVQRESAHPGQSWNHCSQSSETRPGRQTANHC